MKSTAIFIFSVLMPMFMSAQKYPTGITPYTLTQACNYFCRSEHNNGDALLRKLGYSRVGQYDRSIGCIILYARKCNLRVSNSGQNVSATPTTRDGYASYISIDIGVGLDTSMDVTFVSSTGANAFANLLRQTKYRLRGRIWEQAGTDNCFIQKGRTFIAPGDYGLESFDY